jgi:hypothetical protein
VTATVVIGHRNGPAGRAALPANEFTDGAAGLAAAVS